MLFRKSIISLAVVSCVSVPFMAQASNVDVNNFLIKMDNAISAPQDENAYHEAANAFVNLNARDRYMVRNYSPMMGADRMGFINKMGPLDEQNPANIPAGWEQAKTGKQIQDAFKAWHPVRAAAAPVATTEPTQAELKARYAELMEKERHASAGVPSYENQLNQLNEQHYQALVAGNQQAANEISQKTDALIQAKEAQDKIHIELHGSQKVEAPENINGDQFKRRLINLAEHNEGLAHEARYQGILKSAGYVAQAKLTPATTPIVEAAAPAAQSHADQLKAAILAKRQGAELAAMNRSRTASQHVDGATAAAADAQHTADQAMTQAGTVNGKADVIQKEVMDVDQRVDGVEATANHANSNATAAIKSAFSTSQRVTGDELAQMNRDRTATQHVDAVEAAKRSIPTPTNGKDGVDGKNGAQGAAGVNGRDGVTTTITKVEVDQQTRDQVKATTKGMFENRTQINANTGEILSHSRAIADNKAAIDHNSARIDGLNKNFSALRDEVSENKKQASAGISGAMAMANIPQVSGSQRVAIGAGVGGYDGENALAVGVSFRVSPAVTVKATVSDDTQQNVGYGAGVSVGW